MKYNSFHICRFKIYCKRFHQSVSLVKYVNNIKELCNNDVTALFLWNYFELCCDLNIFKCFEFTEYQNIKHNNIDIFTS